MNFHSKASIVLILLCSCFLSVTANAGRGKDIFEAIDVQNQGFENWDYNQDLILTNSMGKESLRVMRVLSLEGKDEQGDKTLVVFRKPKDSKGISLLTHSVNGGDDDQQWMYLPNLKRVKRIAPGGKKSRFVGSEFTFEGLEFPLISKFFNIDNYDDSLWVNINDNEITFE